MLEEATEYQARTLHSLIRAKEYLIRNDKRHMLHDEGNYETVDSFEGDIFELQKANFVIVDEASMMDTSLLFSLLSKTPDECHVLLVGDIDQLPSIGPGQVLKDTIVCGKIKVTELTEIHRQEKGSDIIQHAHAIKNGHVIETNYLQDTKDLDFTNESVHFVEVPETENVPATVKEIARIVKETIGTSDDFHECQILTPTNDLKTDINKIFQELNPNQIVMQLKTTNMVFKINDRVVQTRNDYKKGVSNGTMGNIIERKKGKKACIYVSFDIGDKKRKTVEYDESNAEDLDLGYATTVHKAQGSGFSFVVIALPQDVYWKLLTRKWIYTAVTRGKHHVIIVGNKRSYSRAVLNTLDQQRTTLLRLLLEKRLPTLKCVKAVIHE